MAHVKSSRCYGNLRSPEPHRCVHLLFSYFGLLVGVPSEGNGVIGNLLDVANGVEALFVVS